MLKYFKRQKSQRSTENSEVAVTASRPSSVFCDDFLEEDSQSLRSYSGLSIEADIDEDIFNYHSRLSMSLTSILEDTDCMTCFVQYLESRDALSIIKFYLDTKNFKISALEQIAKRNRNATNACTESFEKINNTHEAEGDKGCENSAKAANNVPELKTLCDLSMHKPLTDDEKSQIYAETNKQITRCSEAASVTQKENSLCGADNDYTQNSQGIFVSQCSIKDAIIIYQKYLSPNAQFFVDLPVSLLSDISLLLCKREDESEIDDQQRLPVSAYCFEDAQQFVLNQLERLYLNDFLQSPFYCKYCLQLIVEEKLTIIDVLYSEVTLFFFMEYLEQRGERECLDFWTAAINFRKSYVALKHETTDLKEIQEDAMIIYKKFFSLQTEGRLWLSDKLRSRVEASICASPDKIANCFDLALIVTAKYLEKKHFNDFLKSELFAQYLNELKSKVHESQRKLDSFEDMSKDTVDFASSLPSLQQESHYKSSKDLTCSPILKRGHQKTFSDCTNYNSQNSKNFKQISQHNTLLAMDTSNKHLKNSQTCGTPMNIDAKQFNLLWHRRYSNNESETHSGGLKFGHVNALGRYERDFETIDSFNSQAGVKNHWTLGVSGNKIKNAMRKLVHLPEHKAQEEIAWQIAEMIVKDVTSVTLKNTPMANGIRKSTSFDKKEAL